MRCVESLDSIDATIQGLGNQRGGRYLIMLANNLRVNFVNETDSIPPAVVPWRQETG
jgi:hypothetical protein